MQARRIDDNTFSLDDIDEICIAGEIEAFWSRHPLNVRCGRFCFDHLRSATVQFGTSKGCDMYVSGKKVALIVTFKGDEILIIGRENADVCIRYGVMKVDVKLDDWMETTAKEKMTMATNKEPNVDWEKAGSSDDQ